MDALLGSDVPDFSATGFSRTLADTNPVYAQLLMQPFVKLLLRTVATFMSFFRQARVSGNLLHFSEKQRAQMSASVIGVVAMGQGGGMNDFFAGMAQSVFAALMHNFVKQLRHSYTGMTHALARAPEAALQAATQGSPAAVACVCTCVVCSAASAVSSNVASSGSSSSPSSAAAAALSPTETPTAKLYFRGRVLTVVDGVEPVTAASPPRTTCYPGGIHVRELPLLVNSFGAVIAGAALPMSMSFAARIVRVDVLVSESMVLLGRLVYESLQPLVEFSLKFFQNAMGLMPFLHLAMLVLTDDGARSEESMQARSSCIDCSLTFVRSVCVGSLSWLLEKKPSGIYYAHFPASSSPLTFDIVCAVGAWPGRVLLWREFGHYVAEQSSAAHAGAASASAAAGSHQHDHNHLSDLPPAAHGPRFLLPHRDVRIGELFHFASTKQLFRAVDLCMHFVGHALSAAVLRLAQPADTDAAAADSQSTAWWLRFHTALNIVEERMQHATSEHVPTEPAEDAFCVD